MKRIATTRRDPKPRKPRKARAEQVQFGFRMRPFLATLKRIEIAGYVK